MTLRFVAAALAVAGIAVAVETLPPAGQLVAHEWGTFTSVADANGYSLPWLTLSGPSALPCFVHLPPARPDVKGRSIATVRMETPVIYFYTPRKTTLNVGVGFPNGRFTEWYPQATDAGEDRLIWKGVEVLPGEALAFPQTERPNHYFEARATDSAPLRIGKEQEKLIFYRGIADLAVPVRQRFLDEGRIELRQAGTAPVPSVILFENRGGKMGFRAIGTLEGKIEIDRPQLTGDSAGIRGQLAEALVKSGLYPKEAAAMLATWRESWFEEGMRVFYIAPRTMIDAVLPLTIQPAPASLERVFVGRVEILPPESQKEIVEAAAKGDRQPLLKYSRFLYAFWNDLKAHGILAKSADLWSLVPYKEVSCVK